MKRSVAIVGATLFSFAFAAVLAYFAHAGGLPVLSPSGAIALAERDLMWRTVLLMLIVVVPVYTLIILIAWHYRASNTKAVYTPHWENSLMEEFIWWTIPFEIILVLGALTWGGTHALAPEKPIVSSASPVLVDVVALPWRWLFIYPDQGTASLNELVIPAGHPVTFQITADAPMNSFWIPALGGQMYAMTGMVSQLNLIADKPGVFEGKSANYSGEGFAGMHFTVRALSDADYADWTNQVKRSENALTPESYTELAKPTPEAGPVRYFGSISITLATILEKYMPHTNMQNMPDMDMQGMDMSGMNHSP